MIALLTDFGPDNHYVAQMKARIFQEVDHAIVIDITHSISPQNIAEGGYILRDTIEAFSPGTIFVAVVDPGVGTNRKILIVESNQQYFVLPDNGLIGVVENCFGIAKAIDVDTSEFESSSTFHGRDIMAPTAGRIESGVKPESLGRLIDAKSLNPFPLNGPTKELTADGDGFWNIDGQIVYSDKFGNLISNIPGDWLPPNRSDCLVKIGRHQIAGIQGTYGDVEADQLIALIGSHNRLEIAVTSGNAKKLIGCEPLERVQVRWKNVASAQMLDQGN